MSTFTMTSNGFIFTNTNNEEKVIEIDDATNTIDFQQLNISTPSISNKEYVARFKPVDKEALEIAVQDWGSGDPVTRATAIATYGEINTWDTSLITDMSNLFDGAVDFNDDISSWNTSSVTSMEEMFFMANSFNQDISSWDVGEVISMRSAFNSATAFNQDISSWNTSKVESMRSMFSQAPAFNQNLSAWDVAAVTTFQSMWTLSTTMLGQNGYANRLAIHAAWNGNANWTYQWGS